MKKYKNWDDCIHIHACRRFACIVERKTGKNISRGCGNNCEAFASRQTVSGYLAEIDKDILHASCELEYLKNESDDYYIAQHAVDNISTSGLREYLGFTEE